MMNGERKSVRVASGIQGRGQGHWVVAEWMGVEGDRRLYQLSWGTRARICLGRWVIFTSLTSWKWDCTISVGC